MMMECCMYLDIIDPTQPCTHSVTEVMLGHHIKLVHCHNKETEGNKPKIKIIKRMDPKPLKFLENKIRDKLTKKQAEFRAYTNRAKISGEDKTDNL